MKFNADILIPKLKEHVELSEQHQFQMIDFESNSSSLKNLIGEVALETTELLQFSKSKLDDEIMQSEHLQMEYEQILGRIEKFQRITATLLKRLTDLRYQAGTAFVFWNDEYEKALVWLEKATNRYNNAEKELEIAEQNLKRAEEYLRRQIKNQDDDSGIISSMIENSRIRKAKQGVRMAKEKANYWSNEKQNAYEDLQKAKEQVRCTNQAVIYATTAVEKGNSAVKTGEIIKEIKEKIITIYEQTEKFFKEIDYKLKTKQDILQIMNDYYKKISDTKEYFFNNIVLLQNVIETSVSLLITANDETEFKINKLIEFSK